MANLITAAYAKQALQADSSFSSGDDDIIDDLVAACSRAIEAFCRRTFDARTYDELYSGGDNVLLLRHYPVQSVTWLRANPRAVLEVANTSASNQQAWAEVRSDRIALYRVASGTLTTDTSVTFSGNATLSACATAINALGNGWSARVIAGYETWPSADLYIAPRIGDGTRSQGGRGCAVGSWAGLTMHVDFLSEQEWTPDGHVYRLDHNAQWHDSRSPLWPHQPGGYRVKYTAGYTSVPDSIQAACAAWVADLYFRWKRDPGVQATSDTDAGTATSYTAATGMPAVVRDLISPYRRAGV